MKCLQVLVLVCVAACVVACKSEPKSEAAGSGKPGGAGGGPRGPMAFPVEVAPVETRDVQLVLSAVGSVDAYERVQVTAPVAGTIETRNVQTGQYAQPGAVLATLVRRDPLLVRFSVPEGDAGKLARDQQVSFRVQGGDEAFLAKITHIAALADVATRMVPVTGEVNPEQRDRLRPGSFAEVSIAVGGRGKAPIVPERAVRPSERGFIAYVVEGDVARERVVALGMHTEDGHVEVLSGLREGELLVVRGSESLKEGAKVLVSPAAGSSPEARK
jgi:multidrug efflux system membrane fusion protein